MIFDFMVVEDKTVTCDQSKAVKVLVGSVVVKEAAHRCCFEGSCP